MIISQWSKLNGKNRNSIVGFRDELFDEYLKFVVVQASKPPKSQPTFCPSSQVDEIWHAHIVCTREYAAFCKKYSYEGEFIHHSPAPENISSQKNYLSTLEQYTKLGFGDAIETHPECWDVLVDEKKTAAAPITTSTASKKRAQPPRKRGRPKKVVKEEDQEEEQEEIEQGKEEAQPPRKKGMLKKVVKEEEEEQEEEQGKEEAQPPRKRGRPKKKAAAAIESEEEIEEKEEEVKAVAENVGRPRAVKAGLTGKAAEKSVTTGVDYSRHDNTLKKLISYKIAHPTKKISKENADGTFSFTNFEQRVVFGPGSNTNAVKFCGHCDKIWEVERSDKVYEQCVFCHGKSVETAIRTCGCC